MTTLRKPEGFLQLITISPPQSRYIHPFILPLKLPLSTHYPHSPPPRWASTWRCCWSQGLLLWPAPLTHLLCSRSQGCRSWRKAAKRIHWTDPAGVWRAKVEAFNGVREPKWAEQGPGGAGGVLQPPPALPGGWGGGQWGRPKQVEFILGFNQRWRRAV